MVVPPHMLKSMARQGNKVQRERALHTLATDSSFRTLRETRQRLLLGSLQRRQRAAVLHRLLG
jgi:hypothetical protein